ncbi:hypothetical protein AZF37_09680 (plasmid) [endosymbiont 'TC1' of Trimyema compressum]|uniref:hypothetical protein n=1 Tax=endosymbiont 'TC1' of Trimyema compressum TaxID=243899 RepID=UPI0007F0E2A4|nr:hypothetical protein [endosymbiont 'TC1' of Trimyema compressum]AMP21444.1 hypothetical protein AZF37_09680 [endosymbiont 'TC1' of Trimyema compressum]
MDNILKELELVEVTYSNNNNKALFVFLDRKRGEIREIIFNKQVYNNGEFIDNEEKSAKVEAWCKEYFNLPFMELKKAIGIKKDIYAYDNFNSLFEVAVIEKFTEEETGEILEGEITAVEDHGIGIIIYFTYGSKNYQSKMMYAQYMDEERKWYVNPVKKNRQYKKFKDKFKVPFEMKDELIGKSIIVEVKKAFGSVLYADIKPFLKK